MDNIKPKLLIDKNTNRCISWGYTEFIPKDNEIIVEDIPLKTGIDFSKGYKYHNGKIIVAPELKITGTNSLEYRIDVVESKIKTLETK